MAVSLFFFLFIEVWASVTDTISPTLLTDMHLELTDHMRTEQNTGVKAIKRNTKIISFTATFLNKKVVKSNRWSQNVYCKHQQKKTPPCLLTCKSVIEIYNRTFGYLGGDFHALFSLPNKSFGQLNFELGLFETCLIAFICDDS